MTTCDIILLCPHSNDLEIVFFCLSVHLPVRYTISIPVSKLWTTGSIYTRNCLLIQCMRSFEKALPQDIKIVDLDLVSLSLNLRP